MTVAPGTCLPPTLSSFLLLLAVFSFSLALTCSSILFVSCCWPKQSEPGKENSRKTSVEVFYAKLLLEVIVVGYIFFFFNSRFLLSLCMNISVLERDTASILSSDPVPLPFAINTRFFKKDFSTTRGSSYILIDTQDVEAAFLPLSDQDFSQGNIMKST